MTDVTGEYQELFKMARHEAFNAMRGRPVGSCDADDIAQEVVMEFIKIRMRGKTIRRAKSLLRCLAFQRHTIALRRESRHRTVPMTEEPAAPSSIDQQWEARDSARKELLGMYPKNDIQKGIIVHTIVGFDIWNPEDRIVVAECLGTTENNLKVQLSRLKKKKGNPCGFNLLQPDGELQFLVDVMVACHSDD